MSRIHAATNTLFLNRDHNYELCHEKTCSTDTDQLLSNRTADERLCFRNIVQYLFFLNSKFQASSQVSAAVVQPSLCQTRLETPKLDTPKTGFGVAAHWALRG